MLVLAISWNRKYFWSGTSPTRIAPFGSSGSRKSRWTTFGCFATSGTSSRCRCHFGDSDFCLLQQKERNPKENEYFKWMFFMSVHNYNCFIIFNLLIYRIITDSRKYLFNVKTLETYHGNIVDWKHDHQIFRFLQCRPPIYSRPGKIDTFSVPSKSRKCFNLSGEKNSTMKNDQNLIKMVKNGLIIS